MVSSITPQRLRPLLRRGWKAAPFMALVLFVLLIILPLFHLIDAKRQAMADQQAHAAQTERALAHVVTLKIAPKLIQETLNLPGVVRPWVSLAVVAEVRGKIIEKKVKEGQGVNPGDILALIDPRDCQNAYDAARASFETAQIAEKRLVALSKNKFVTQSNLDEAGARVKTSRAQLATAKLNLERCTLRAPMAGIVDAAFVEKGSYLNVGDPVFSLLQVDAVKVRVGIPESDVDAVRNLKHFDMRLDALEGQAYEGTFHHLNKT
ncbi:MAG: efflux RND transporter periplasmic adaptor subunit, partial [Desulfovibrionales bacterium]|nr:efflux RND transporter periplasmic adaptor subunit [Desulfovibrionales bacterium]